jgi:hypothetical protein
VRKPQLSLIVIITSVILILTLLGFFVSDTAALGVQWILVRWAAIIAAFAVLLGFLNVIAVHVRKLTGRSSGWAYSLALIISAVIVLAVGVGELIFQPEEGLWGPIMSPLFVWVIAPLQAATAALLPFVLTYAAFRMMRLGRRGGAFIFLMSALVVLVGQLPLSGVGEGLGEFREAWLSWLAIPGLRAVLIGVALGITVMALRLALGIDRPQSS